MFLSALTRKRDGLLSQLRELNKQKPRAKADDGHVAEITRLESILGVRRDELVSMQHTGPDCRAFHLHAHTDRLP